LLLSGSLAITFAETGLTPQVIGVQPYPGEEMRPDAVLTIVFDQAVPDATLTFDPDIAGAVVWTDDRTLTFTPSDGWPSNNSYDVTVTADALAEPYTFTAVTLSD